MKYRTNVEPEAEAAIKFACFYFYFEADFSDCRAVL
jgi:hypothetical protein